jgi:hypothetical protein
MRALFGLAFSYALLEEMDEFHVVENQIKYLFSTFDCRRVQKRQDWNSTSFHPGYASVSNKAPKPILGPDKIPVAECVSRARNVASATRILISKARIDAQTFLNILINDLEDRSIQCCYAGGVWKACLQPIVNKWQKWNEKWAVFGVPPDPAWD